MKFTSFQVIVSDICSLMGVPYQENYLRIGRVLADVLEEMNLLVFQNVKTDILQILPNLTVALPPDCIAVLRVGMVDSRGQLYLMGRDERIRRVTKFQYENQGCEPEKTAPDSGIIDFTTWYPFINLSTRYEYIGERYGTNVMQHPSGVFRHNSDMNLLEFGSGFDIYEGADVIVEYKSSIGDEMHSKVPVVFKTAIQYRVMSHLTAFTNPAQSAELNRRFLQEYRTAKSVVVRATYTMGDLIAAIKEVTKAAKY